MIGAYAVKQHEVKRYDVSHSQFSRVSSAREAQTWRVADGAVGRGAVQLRLSTIKWKEEARRSSTIKVLHRTELWYAHKLSYHIASLLQSFIPL